VAAARAERPPLELARRAVEVAEDKKAADIVLLDIGAITTLADYFVICSGGSERQIQAIADGVVDALRTEGVRPIGREGEAASHWILVDFGSVIVHVFTPPERDYYELEKHWSEARTILRVQ
jgi:ribosome-associated protein